MLTWNKEVLQTAEPIAAVEWKYVIIVSVPMANYRQQYINSFTLIELIVVITFILIFTGFSIGYYNQFTEQKKLENAGQKVRSILDLGRAKTISGDSSLCGVADVTTAKVDYYSFDILNGGEYVLEPICVIGVPTPILYKTEDHIIFTNTPLSIPFFPVSGGTSCNYIYIKNTILSGASACRYVKVTSTGLISEDSCTACDTCPSSCP